jgi:catechol 2,3-dioxygenase-like lactoylglutathione lyase family enzyme
MDLSTRPIRPTLPASDIERAKAWYKDMLGLSPSEESPAGVEYECGGGTGFGLYPSQFAGTAQNTAAEFDVEDIEEAVADLRERGVTFEEYDFPGLQTQDGIAQLGAFRGAWFKDSEGNIIAITSREGVV